MNSDYLEKLTRVDKKGQARKEQHVMEDFLRLPRISFVSFVDYSALVPESPEGLMSSRCLAGLTADWIH